MKYKDMKHKEQTTLEELNVPEGTVLPEPLGCVYTINNNLDEKVCRACRFFKTCQSAMGFDGV